ncbi:UNVERIFIED_CONTAM: hypothetical protein GTU68_017046 [Idotea baltica]|nr:hypothetical protein [Idotea baltica]
MPISVCLFIFTYGSVYAFTPVTTNIDRATIDIKTIIYYLKLFKAENYTYPTTNEGLQALISNPNSDKYKNWRKHIKLLPTDPWGNKYKYVNSEVNNELKIFSFGPDGIQSKDDVGNWLLDK